MKNASAIGVAESVSWLIGLGEGKERERERVGSVFEVCLGMWRECGRYEIVGRDRVSEFLLCALKMEGNKDDADAEAGAA